MTDAEVAALATLIKDGKSSVRSAAAEALGWSAHWGGAAAGAALAAILADPTLPSDARVAAATGLGIGVPLQAPLGNPDPALFAPLITALTDDDGKVRLAAIVALVGGTTLDAKAAPDSRAAAFGYRPQANAADLAAAQARWQAWLGKHP